MIAIAMNTTLSLYTPLAPDATYDTVFERTFAKGHVTVALRPLSLPADWPHISKWLCREFTRGHAPAAQMPERHLRETFSTMLQCDFAQPFIGLINDQPGFLIEICDGDKQCDGLEEGPHVFENGDHAIRLFLSPTVIYIRNWSLYALLGSLDYFFSYEQVERIVWPLHEKDRHNRQLASQLQFNASTVWPDLQVFLYPREIFNRFLANYHQHMQKWV
jgi:hypothetical protein